MAYFSNSSEGEVFDLQCSQCKYGNDACPIAAVQMAYNYEAVNNEVATKILNALVKNDGTCMMYDEFTVDFDNDSKSFLATGFFDSGKPFRHAEIAEDMESFLKFMKMVYPTFNIESVLEL